MGLSKPKRLGVLIRKHRKDIGFSIRQLAAEIDVRDTTVLRLERGELAAPSPEILTRLAEALSVPLSDLYAAIGYSVPNDLPSPALYLRAKYPDLSAKELSALSKDVEAAFRRRGIDPTVSPADGEDEQPDTRPKPRRTTKTSKKGGRP